MLAEVRILKLELEMPRNVPRVWEAECCATLVKVVVRSKSWCAVLCFLVSEHVSNLLSRADNLNSLVASRQRASPCHSDSGAVRGAMDCCLKTWSSSV